MNKSLMYIIKLTRKCNLNCIYCNDHIEKGEDMNFKVISTILKKTLNNKDINSVHFSWHGGEPLLKGLDFFKKILLLQDKLKNDIKIINAIQTNGLLFNEEWAEFCKKYNFKVGLSLDGPPEINNFHRKFENNFDSYSSSQKALSLLQKYEIPYSVLSVVTGKTISYGAQKIFEFFIDNNIKQFSFLPVRPPTAPKIHYKSEVDYIDNKTFSNFMKDIYDLWVKKDDSNIHIRSLNNILETMLGSESSVCNNGNCIGNYFSIEPTGDIYHCDRFNYDPFYKLGNILANNIVEILQSEKLKNLREKENKRIQECKNCNWFSICQGGCPSNARVTKWSNDSYCCEYKGLYEHIYTDISEKIRVL